MSELAAGLVSVVGDAERVMTQPQVVERLSRDFYWYSPVLKAQLDDKRADVVVQPVSLEEICAVMSYCFERGVPVTVRGQERGTMGRRCRCGAVWCSTCSGWTGFWRLRRTEWPCASQA